MYKLEENLRELVERNAARVLVEGGTLEGMHALHRMLLLFSMIDRLDASGDSWTDYDMLPSMAPLGWDSGRSPDAVQFD